MSTILVELILFIDNGLLLTFRIIHSNRVNSQSRAFQYKLTKKGALCRFIYGFPRVVNIPCSQHLKELKSRCLKNLYCRLRMASSKLSELIWKSSLRYFGSIVIYDFYSFGIFQANSQMGFFNSLISYKFVHLHNRQPTTE